MLKKLTKRAKNGKYEAFLVNYNNGRAEIALYGRAAEKYGMYDNQGPNDLRRKILRGTWNSQCGSIHFVMTRVFSI